MFIVEHSCEDNREAQWSTAPPGGGAASPRGQALAALRASCLLDRFYSWKGISEERYVCSIFSLEEEAIVAGFAQVVVIGVVRDARGRRPVCVLSSRHFKSEQGRMIRFEARALGVNEWHVRFGSSDDALRDLADSLLN